MVEICSRSKCIMLFLWDCFRRMIRLSFDHAVCIIDVHNIGHAFRGFFVLFVTGILAL